MDLTDIKAIAEKHQTTPQVVGAYLSTLKNSPNIYRELLKAGYEDPVIPGWVARGTSEDCRGPGWVARGTSVDLGGPLRTRLKPLK